MSTRTLQLTGIIGEFIAFYFLLSASTNDIHFPTMSLHPKLDFYCPLTEVLACNLSASFSQGPEFSDHCLKSTFLQLELL